MANTRISDLTASASNLAASDLVPVVQTPGVGPVKMTGTQIKTGIIGAGSVSIASGKTFTSSNTLTLAGTDSTTMTFPSTSATIARTDAGNTFTGAQTFSVGTVNGTGLDITQTWTGTGTYTGLKYNVGTDSGPANAASLLLDLQVGGNSQLSVSKAGTGLFAGAVRVYGGSGQFEIYSSSALSTRSFYAYDGGAGSTTVALGSGGIIGWGSTSAAGTDSLILRRAAAATLQLGAADTTGTTAPTPQLLRVQSWSSSTNNNQLGADFTIQGSRGTGTGAGGSIIFQVAPAGGSSNGVQNAYSTALTIDSTRLAAFGGSIQVPNAATLSNVAGTAIIYFGSGDLRLYTNAVNSQFAYFNSPSQLLLGANTRLAWNNAVDSGTNGADTILVRDGQPNTLALRNGTNAQRFNVYNTYTSSTNYETFKIDWITTANTCLIGTEKGSGGGNARDLALQTDGTTRLTIAANGDVITQGNQYVNGTLAVGSTSASNVFAAIGSAYGGIKTVSTAEIRWGNSTTDGLFGTVDLILGRDTSNTLGLRNSTNAQTFNVYGSYVGTTNYQRVVVKTLREVSSALSGATYVSTIAIPAYALLVGVTTRVNTAITGATSYSVGDGTTANLWGNNIGIALNSQSRTSDFTAVGAVGAAATSRTVTLTANGSNFTGGVVEICLHYLTTEAD